MSNNLPEPQPSDEVDLGQLFKLIGKAFDRLFKFIGSIFNKLFLVFVWMFFFIKKHFIKIAIAGIIGFALGIVKQKFVKPVYKSEIVIKQNYNSGESLYRTIDYINQLLLEKDSITLSDNLRITPKTAASLLSFSVEPILNDNQRMSLFDDYTKSLDSVLAQSIDFETYVENASDYSFGRQKITLRSYSKESSSEIVTELINNVKNIDFFKNEQKKDLAQLNRRENIIRESLKESDTLQNVYKNVLEKSVEKVAGGTTSITFEGADDKSVTKEFELYNSDLELRRELVNIERNKEDKEYIIEIISNKQTAGTLDNSNSLLGFEINYKIKYAFLLSLFVFMLLLFVEFMNYLERYKNKI